MEISFIVEHRVTIPLAENEIFQLIGNPLEHISTMEDFRSIEEKGEVESQLLEYRVSRSN